MSHETARFKHRVKSFMAIMGAAIMAAALVLLSGHPASGAIATVQDTDRPNTQYGNWMFTTDPGASGGWESTTREPEASAKLKFKGTSVVWKTITYEGGGITDVFLDAKKVASFDGYSTGDTRYNVTGFSRKGLPKGMHTLKLVVTGQKRPGTFGDIFTILDRIVVDGKTIQEDSRKISYDGWSVMTNSKASVGAYHQSKSQTLGARCGMFSGPEIGLITATGPTRGMARVRVKDTFTGNWVRNELVNLNSPTTEWQHVEKVTGLESNKNYILEVISDDGTPVVFDGCTGNLNGAIN